MIIYNSLRSWEVTDEKTKVIIIQEVTDEETKGRGNQKISDLKRLRCSNCFEGEGFGLKRGIAKTERDEKTTEPREKQIKTCKRRNWSSMGQDTLFPWDRREQNKNE